MLAFHRVWLELESSCSCCWLAVFSLLCLDCIATGWLACLLPLLKLWGHRRAVIISGRALEVCSVCCIVLSVTCAKVTVCTYKLEPIEQEEVSSFACKFVLFYFNWLLIKHNKYCKSQTGQHLLQMMAGLGFSSSKRGQFICQISSFCFNVLKLCLLIKHHCKY